MTDLSRFAARVQAAIALMLVIAITLSTAALIGEAMYLAIHKLGLPDPLASLLNTLINALINMGMVGVGFWLARHRAQTADGNSDSDPTQPAAPAQPKV